MASNEDPSAEAPESGPNSVERYACALHEVSNALTVVLGWLDVAGRADSLEEVQKAIVVAQEHARRGQVMARRSIGADADSSNESRTAAALLKFAATSVGPQALAAGVSLEVESGTGTDVGLDSEDEVLQILTNLLLNAIAFSPEGTTVKLSARRDAQSVIFRVLDEGPGISDTVAQDLFRVKASTRRGGCGIGLPLSYKMAVENGGDLRLSSVVKGTCFELSWPTGFSVAMPSSSFAQRAGALADKRVLVIEDDVSISSLVELSLEAHGGQVLSVVSGEQLDEVLAARPVFDAVLLDLSPVKNRLTAVLEQLRKLGPQAPVILMSGEPTGVPDEAQGQFASWVRKPFDMDQLLSTLGRLLQETDP